jgi:hypothetical protein
MTTKPKGKLLTKIMLLTLPPEYFPKNTVNLMSVCISARPSVRIEKIRSHWTSFYEIICHLI